MSKKVATPKQTAGGGFTFEDKVVGYYLVFMLAGGSPQNNLCDVVRIDCQVAADGWEGFDDLLVTLSKDGIQRRYAFSLKSKFQFTKESAPASLVRSAWSLLLHHISDVIDIDNDMLGLICVPHPEPPRAAVQSLLKKASWQTPEQLSERLVVSGYASDFERSIHNSCSCPADLTNGLNEEQTLAGNILKRMSVIELDFENIESFSESNVLFICSKLVTSGTKSDANNLWNAILQIAQSVRTSGGGISRDKLISEVRSIVELRELPDFTRDWHHLDEWLETELSAIPDKIAGVTVIDRDDVTAEVMNSLQRSRFVALVGASGTGKSVLSKRVAEDSREVSNVLWFKGERVRPGYVESFASYHHLRHPLREVLNTGKHKSGLVILDSGERLLDDADFAEFCLFLHVLEMQQEGSVWRLLLTCREESWERVQHSLTQSFGQMMVWKPVRIKYPSFGALSPLWDSFPALRTLAIRPHLSQMMRNFKVLDLLATVIKTGRNIDTHSWIGESKLIEWYWKQVVRRGKKGAQRDVLLRKLATGNADNSRFETPETNFTDEELNLVGDSYDMLRTDSRRGMVSFTHDLIADWARLRVLVSLGHEFSKYSTSRFSNPLWQTAFRLYGVSLLETDKTGEKWKSVILAYPKLQDLFLESLVFTGDSCGFINSVWPVLVADEGFLLQAFLKRFQYIASIPNPEYIKFATQIDDAFKDEARTLERIPLWMYWLGVLKALSGHVEDLLKLTPTETARLARSWLRKTPQDWPGRQEAAMLAIAVAQQAISANLYDHNSDGDSKLFYTAFLEAYSDKPDTVRELLLRAAARRVPTEENGIVFVRSESTGNEMYKRSMFKQNTGIVQEPWPDGPLYQIDSTFRAACLNTDALHEVMTHAPELAKEIILALIIKHRPSRMEPGYSKEHLLPEDAVCLQRERSFHPGFYKRGPFLLFLRINPEAALQTIIKLIDFATERWMESNHGEENIRIGIDLPLRGEIKRYIGDDTVYRWYRGFSQSHIISSALMAIEKWFYECLDKKETIDGWIDLILKRSQSTAFLGLLSEIGKYAPTLFKGPLCPLLLVLETYFQETKYAFPFGNILGTPFSPRDGEWFFNLAREWDAMEHRQQRVIDIATELFHSNTKTRKAILSVRTRWIDTSHEDDKHLSQYKERLIAIFDEKNWKSFELPDGSKGIAYEEPEHLRIPPDQLGQIEKGILLQTLPGKCRRMLDEKNPLEAEQIFTFFEKNKELLGFEQDDQKVDWNSQTAAVLLGMIAVLFVLHRDWLQANPEEEKWCVKILDQILAHPPPWPKFDIPESIGKDDWEHFACEIAPIIWAENPENRESRKRIFYLALAKHYSATGILLFRAFERRGELGDGFWELLNLLLDWAEVRYEFQEARSNGDEYNLSRWVNQSVNRFISGKYSKDVLPWGQLSVEKGKLCAVSNHPRYNGAEDVHVLYRVPELDIQQIQATFESVFLPDQATSACERNRFLKFWDEALVTCLAGAQFFDENGDEIDPELIEAALPYEYGNWVLERLAVIIAQMQPDEEPERYWKPILSLGAKAVNWVEHFLYHWFKDAKKTMNQPAFVQEWRRMLEFCLNSDIWTEEKGRSQFHLSSLWMHLMGISNFTTNLWQDEDSLIVSKMDVFFVIVVPHILITSHNAVHFLSWLCKASAKGIRRQLLKQVAEAGLSATEYWWTEQSITKVVARYLGLLWEEHGQTLQHSSGEKQIFFELLHKAAGMQEPLAMELQKRIISYI